jgi:4-carboxymuconolactone decarboxylase
MESNDRYQRGLEKLKEIDGDHGEQVVEAIRAISPDFARYLVEFPFGDIYSRPQLGLRERELATVAALAAMGNAEPQLKVHLNAALNVGCTREEILEVVIQMAVYAGFPAALRALFNAKDVFSSRAPEAAAPATPAQIVEEYFKAFLGGDLEKALNMLTDDVVWHVQGAPNVPTVGVRHGKSAVRDWMVNFPLNFKPLDFELGRTFESGNEIIVTGRFRHLVLPTGREVGSELAIHFILRDGKIASYKILEDSYALYLAFANTAALEQARG